MVFRSNKAVEPFANRHAAGRLLGNALLPHLAHVPPENQIVLGLARGGVAVAVEVALILNVPLDACVVRKIGSPMQPELAIGAVAPGGVRIFNQGLIAEIGLSRKTVDRLGAEVERERSRLESHLRAARPLPDLKDKYVVLVDDGLATGATMRAALEYASDSAESVIVAVPTASPDVIRDFEALGVLTISLIAPRNFRSVGLWYDRFEEVTSEDVISLLAEAAQGENVE